MYLSFVPLAWFQLVRTLRGLIESLDRSRQRLPARSFAILAGIWNLPKFVPNNLAISSNQWLMCHTQVDSPPGKRHPNVETNDVRTNRTSATGTPVGSGGKWIDCGDWRRARNGQFEYEPTESEIKAKCELLRQIENWHGANKRASRGGKYSVMSTRGL